MLALGTTPHAQQAPPAFRWSATVIAVDAAVIDKNGAPVTDLTAADFQIIEDGRAHDVQTIYLVSADPAFVRAGAGAGTAGTADAAAASAATTPPVRRELRSRVVVFYFDLAHLSADGYKRSRSAVEGFLKDATGSADLVGVLAGTTMLNNKIDSDKAGLLKAMNGMKGPNLSRFGDMRSFPRILDEAEATAIARGNEETIVRATLRACAEQPEECQGKGGNEVVRKQIEAKGGEIASEALRDAQSTLAAVQTLANGLGRLPGSKNVIVFSDGFFTVELGDRLKDIVTLAARNGVRFSTMDTRGLSRDPRTQNFMAAQPFVTAGDLSSVSSDTSADVLSSLAWDTGGEMFMNRNDLRPSLDRVMQSAGTYYVLGYAPTRTMDGKYHEVTVNVLRPGVTVRARRGYIATAPAAAGAAAASTASGASGVATAPPPPETSLSAGNAADAAPAPTPAAPRFRPNSDKNVAELTRVAPAVGDATAAKALADAGWDAYALGDLVVAREKLSAAVATGQAAPWVSYALGFAQYALGQFDAAAQSWTRVRTAVPQFMPVYFDLADAFISLGRGTDALGILRDAAKRWPTEPEPQNALGTQLVRRGALDEAIDIFTALTTARPADSLGFFNLGRAHQLRYLKLQQNAAAARIPTAASIGDDDRQKAIAAFRKYLTLGGPFEKDAKDAIATLDWK